MNETVKVTLTSELIKLLNKAGVTISQLFILQALQQQAKALLEGYSVAAAMDYTILLLHGYLSDGNVLTEKATSFLQDVAFLNESDAPVENHRQLAEKYLELFPKIKLPSGVYSRVAISEIEKKLKAFKLNYKKLFREYYKINITDEVILDATKKYIAKYEKNKYLYMQNSSYFLQKKDKSALADEILAIYQGTEKQVDKFEKQI